MWNCGGRYQGSQRGWRRRFPLLVRTSSGPRNVLVLTTPPETSVGGVRLVGRCRCSIMRRRLSWRLCGPRGCGGQTLVSKCRQLFIEGQVALEQRLMACVLER